MQRAPMQKLATTLAVLLPAIGAAAQHMSGVNHYRASPYTGKFLWKNCNLIKEAFANPPGLLLTQLRNSPRQADDFVRNYSLCNGTNAIGWSVTTQRNCKLVESIGDWLARHDVALSGKRRSALTPGFWLTWSGNSADLANNANDCLVTQTRYLSQAESANKRPAGARPPVVPSGEPSAPPMSAPRPPATRSPATPRVAPPLVAPPATEFDGPVAFERTPDQSYFTMHVYSGAKVNIVTLGDVPPPPLPGQAVSQSAVAAGTHWRDGFYY